MSKNAEIKKIVLELGNKEVELNIEQAKKLHGLLDEMFGVKAMPTYPYLYPIYIERHRPYWNCGNEIWCNSDNSIQASYSTDTMSISL